ncbi:MAG: type II toxin-antitoxin system Phd/YefM family antitoxin [Nitrospinae bacterium]|nr:type II toxin-antitoxin system Phd/YefM family antitoxin [Nitrospinota bacterium]
MKLHPEILTKNGKKEFVVLPYEEFVALRELLANAEDILDLRAAKKKEADRPSVGLKQVRDKFLSK